MKVCEMSDNGKVLITDYAWPDLKIEKKIFDQAGIEVVQPSDDSRSELIRAAKGVSGILTNWKIVDKEVVDAAGELQIVSRTGIGLDNIDLNYCAEKGIVVTNVPDYCVDEVAQHALGLILAMARGITFQHHQCKDGIYKLDSGNRIRRIIGQKVGLIGTGNTAKRLAEICRGIGFDVLTYSRSGKTLAGCQAVDFDQLLAESDFVSLHVPATEDTKKMMNQEAFSKMKQGAYLVNIARGALVDQSALFQAIESGHLAGAGLDVQDPEPANLSDPLFQHPQVIVTPHAAFWSEEALQDLRIRSATQVADKLTGKTPDNVVS